MKNHFILTSALSLAIVGGASFSPLSAFAYESSDITDYFNAFKNVLFYAEEYQIEQGLESVYNTVAYISIARNSDSGISDIYNYVLPITKVSESSDKITYTCGTGSYVYTSDTSGNVSAVSPVTGTFALKSNGVQIRDGTLWYFDTSKSKVCLYCDVPQYVKNSSDDSYRGIDYSAVSPAFTQFTKNLSTGTIPNNTKAIKNAIPTPTQPYTTPAPGFPNLPDNWVNPDFDLPEINLPDLDVNIEIPEFTYPTQPQIAEDVENGIGGIGKIIYDFLNGTGLLWLSGVMLFLWLLCYILGR